MKKSVLMFALIVIAFGCKKDYTCRCTVTTYGRANSSGSIISESTKSDAKTKCESRNDPGNADYSISDCHLE